MKATFRFVIATAGLAGLGLIVHEVLKKWQLIGADRGILWTIVPLWALLALREASSSLWFREKVRMPMRLAGALTGVVSALLVVLAILALISIPFLWFGIIEDLAQGGGASR